MDEQLIHNLKGIITPQGILTSGNGILINAVGKTNEILDKIQKFEFFQEKRQSVMEQQNNEIIQLLREISAKLK